MARDAFGRLFVVALLAVSALVGPARAGSVMTLSPEAVLANSDAAFLGRVVAVTPRWSGAPGKSSIWTDYVFQVEDILNDDAGLMAAAPAVAGGTKLFVLPILGGRIGNEAHTAHGVPTFAMGERAFIFTAASQQGSICPALGWWQGVYRVREVNGREVVTSADACCAPAQGSMVQRHFFAKVATASEGFTPAEFAEEVRRALPLARQREELTLEAMRRCPENLPPAAFTHERLGVCAYSEQAAPPGDVSAAEFRPPAAAPVPAHPIVMLPPSPGDYDEVIPPAPPVGARFGFFADEPDFPWRFNIAPNMGAFAADVANQMGYWNIFTGNGLFYTYNNPTNTFNFGNDRNEVGFATDAVLMSQGYGTWGTSIGLCRTREMGGEIKEADIYFNANSGVVWTLDYTTAFNSSAAMNLNPTLLFQRTAVHELGHSFGLHHQWIPNPGATFPSVMNYVPAWLRYDSAVIYADDANGLRAAYPEFSLFITDATVELWHQDGTQGPGPGDRPNTTRVTTISPSSVQRGNALQIGSGSSFFTVTNAGTTTVTPRADFFLCPTNGNFTGAVYCGSSNLANMPGGATSLLQRSIIVPPATLPGNYFVGVNLVVPGDQFGFSNQTWSYQPVAVTASVPANDNAATATILPCTGGFASGTTVGATSSGLNACLSGVGPDVWFIITPCTSGLLVVDTCGSDHDTVAHVLTSSLGEVTCNDDAIGGPCNGTRQSYLTAAVTAGSSYYIRLAGYQTAIGNYNLSVRVQPSNDSCGVGQFCSVTARMTINANVVGTTIGATASAPGDYPPCPFLDPFVGPINIEDRPDVWYAFDAPCTGTVAITADGSASLTHVGVYDRCRCLFASTPVLLSCGQPVFGSFHPITSFSAVAGQRYFVRVRCVLGPSNFVIQARYQSLPDDDCHPTLGVRTAATLTAAAPGADITFDTACAGPSGLGVLPGACFDGASFEPGNDQIVGVQVQTPGTLRITRCFGSYIPSLAVYSGSCADGLSLFACGYSRSPSCDPVVVNTPVSAGQFLFLRVAGHTSYSPLAGFTTLHLQVVPSPTGACCAATGVCTVATGATCGQIYQGDGTTCNPNPCPQPTGACCIGPGDCRLLTPGNCAAQGGSYTGDGLPCLVEPGNVITCCIANFNGQNGLTVQDIFDFLAAYFSGDPAADLGRNGLSVQDIFDFLAAYFTGC